MSASTAMFLRMSDPTALATTYFETLERRDWAALSACLDPDVVYEMPQSRERIRGREKFLQFNQEYPGDWHLSPRLVVADSANAVVRFDWTLDDEAGVAVTFLGLDGDRIVSVTDFWPDTSEPNPSRVHLVEPW